HRRGSRSADPIRLLPLALPGGRGGVLSRRGFPRLRVTCWIGVDTGWTFTDVVAIDESTGSLHITKTASTPADPSAALLEGLRKVGRAGAFPVPSLTWFAPGTTAATNAVLQGDFSRLGLLVTKGFRHVLEIARHSVPDGYGNSYFWVNPPC